MDKPPVTVVVVTWGFGVRLDTFEECRKALDFQDYPNYDVLVIKDVERRGLAFLRDKAIKIAKGELILFIDDDAVAKTDWISRLVEAYQFCVNEYEKVGGLQGTVLEYGTSRVHWTGVRMTLSNSGIQWKFVDTPFAEVDTVGGGNALFSKRALEEVGGFDEKFRYQYDDVDLALRLKSRKYKLFYAPEAVVWHKKADLPGKTLRDRVRGRRFYEEEGLFLLYKKHFPNAWLFCARKVLYLPLAVFFMIGQGIKTGKDSQALFEDVLSLILGRLSGLVSTP